MGLCHCAGCCRSFTAEAPFKAHQRLNTEGRSVCRDPSTATVRVVGSEGERRPMFAQRADGVWRLWSDPDAPPREFPQ